MGLIRTMMYLISGASLVAYFVLAGELTDTGQLALIAVIAVSAFMGIATGGAGAGKRSETQPVRSATTTSDRPTGSDPSSPASEDEGEASAQEVPEPVRADPLDGVTLRERKMAKVRGGMEAAQVVVAEAQEGPESDEEEAFDDEEDEEVVAEEFVIEVTADSIEEAQIAAHVRERLTDEDRIRSRIEARRRKRMAEVRATTARMWDSIDEGEDLVGLLAQPDHGMELIDEPAHIAAGITGTTFVRLDEGRILRLRLNLESGFRRVESEAESPEDDPLEGLEMPDGMAAPPPPDAMMTGGAASFAALKAEIESDR